MRFEWSTGLSEDAGAQLVALLNQVARSSATNGISRPLTNEEGTAFVRRLNHDLSVGDVDQLLAWGTDGRLMAAATLDTIRMNPSRAHVIEVKRVVADERHRGFARFLIEGWTLILDRCEARGVDIIAIDVSEDGPHAMWQRLGFVVTGTMDDYARNGERRLKGYFMHVHVSEARAILDEFKQKKRFPRRAGAGRDGS